MRCIKFSSLSRSVPRKLPGLLVLLSLIGLLICIWPDSRPAAAQQAVPERRQPKGLAGVGLTAEQVNTAIDNGAKFLWNYLKEKDVKENNSPLGERREHLLCMLALVHADAHHKFPDFDQALKKYLSGMTIEQVRSQSGGYETGLLNMLIEGYGDPHYLPALRAATRYLLEAQGQQGFFVYHANVPEEVFVETKADHPLRVAGGLPPEGVPDTSPPWKRVTKATPDDDGDNSVSQFAILGLHSASRLGIKLPGDAWTKTLAGIRQRQDDDGGWDYHEKGSSYGSMTCAGICGLAITRFELGEKDYANDPAIQRGLDWLGQNFKVDQNPNSGSYAYYYLYSVERVGRILDVDFIGDHEWYPQGARYLVDQQKPDGSWIDPTEDDLRLSTSFALLFLTRATDPLMRQSHPEKPGLLETAVEASAGLRLYLILDCSGSMIEEMDGKRRFDIARGSVSGIVDALPDNTQIALRVYGNTKSAIDPGCDLDTTLAIPMGPLERKALHQQLDKLRAKGRTPLALSLEQAKSDLSGAEGPSEIVLLTDGGEDTIPRKNPVTAAQNLVEDNKNLSLQIVGFDLGNHADWSAQLQNMAKVSGGQYMPAAKEKDLETALRAMVFKTPDSFTVADDAGKELAKGKFGETVSLKEGHYVLHTTYAARDFSQDFWINGGQATAVTFDASQITNAAGARQKVRS